MKFGFIPPLYLRMLLGGLIVGATLRGAVVPIPQSFRQEVALHRSLPPGLPPGRIQLIDLQGDLRCFVSGRWYRKSPSAWTLDESFTPASVNQFRLPGPVEDSGESKTNAPIDINIPWPLVRQILRRGSMTFVVVDDAIWKIPYQAPAIAIAAPEGRRILRASVLTELWIATDQGLFERRDDRWHPVAAIDPAGRSWTAGRVQAVGFDWQARLWVGTQAGLATRDSQGAWKFFEGKDGLPWTEFSGVSGESQDGSVWFSTARGLIRWDGTDFHYRQGQRWLPDDKVTDLVTDTSGGVWAATPRGMGRIEFKPTTLAEKAVHYEREIERHIQRTAYGFVAEAPLRQVADLSTADPQDSDNDGLWTAMYGAGEAFAYAATKDPAALARAKKAFEALRFLQKVTQGGKPSPDAGYVARTVRPVEWPDPNIGRIESDRRNQAHDALWKAYEPRWPKSADGKWFWKGDTSSDELDGHYFLYGIYYDFCAESESEKARVRDVVKSLTDHLIAHDYSLVDVDGKATRWGVYGPKEINRNTYWWVERGLNSLSLLSYLAVTAHVTGDDRYRNLSKELIERHGYLQNLMFPKMQMGPGSGNQSDDEMAFMCFYNLLRYSRDPEVVNQARTAFFQYWVNDQPEMNPFFHFTHAAHNLSQSVSNVWGTVNVSPWNGWLEDSQATLYGLSLDRLNWPHQNSHRLDVVPLPRAKARDIMSPERERRGHRVNGKVLPVENRHFTHWNTDPWDLDYGGDGRELAAGTVFLLPYYLGLYHGFIEKP